MTDYELSHAFWQRHPVSPHAPILIPELYDDAPEWHPAPPPPSPLPSPAEEEEKEDAPTTPLLLTHSSNDLPPSCTLRAFARARGWVRWATGA